MKLEILTEKDAPKTDWGSPSGIFVRTTDDNGEIRFADGLTRDEALWVVAQFFMGRIAMYLNTAHEEAERRAVLDKRREDVIPMEIL